MAEPIILFDGVCNFCSDGVKFVIDRNRSSNLRFCQLQSPKGKALLAEYGVVDPEMDSMALIANGKLYLKSSAALKVCAHMNMPWPALSIFILVPTFIRNKVYDWFGGNRYRWFGKKESCWIPDEVIRQRFLE
jgi:predicted DCC family thiol-disulfide oxidoreductase YuxK